MASRITINIKEDLGYLRSLLKSERDSLVANRIRCLVLIKKEKFKKRKDLAVNLCIGYASLKAMAKNISRIGLRSSALHQSE